MTCVSDVPKPPSKNTTKIINFAKFVKRKNNLLKRLTVTNAGTELVNGSYDIVSGDDTKETSAGAKYKREYVDQNTNCSYSFNICKKSIENPKLENKTAQCYVIYGFKTNQSDEIRNYYFCDEKSGKWHEMEGTLPLPTIETEDAFENAFKMTFKFDSDLATFMIGQKGSNINKAKKCDGVIRINVYTNKNGTSTKGNGKCIIAAKDKECAMKAYDIMNIEKKIVCIKESFMIPQIIGNKGVNAQKMAKEANVSLISSFKFYKKRVNNSNKKARKKKEKKQNKDKNNKNNNTELKPGLDSDKKEEKQNEDNNKQKNNSESKPKLDDTDEKQESKDNESKDYEDIDDDDDMDSKLIIIGYKDNIEKAERLINEMIKSIKSKKDEKWSENKKKRRDKDDKFRQKHEFANASYGIIGAGGLVKDIKFGNNNSDGIYKLKITYFIDCMNGFGSIIFKDREHAEIALARLETSIEKPKFDGYCLRIRKKDAITKYKGKNNYFSKFSNCDDVNNIHQINFGFDRNTTAKNEYYTEKFTNEIQSVLQMDSLLEARVFRFAKKNSNEAPVDTNSIKQQLKNTFDPFNQSKITMLKPSFGCGFAIINFKSIIDCVNALTHCKNNKVSIDIKNKQQPIHVEMNLQCDLFVKSKFYDIVSANIIKLKNEINRNYQEFCNVHVQLFTKAKDKNKGFVKIFISGNNNNGLREARKQLNEILQPTLSNYRTTLTNRSFFFDF